MKTILLVLMSFLMVACGKTEWDECNWPEAARVAARQNPKPKILVIGDSISGGYEFWIQKQMPNYYVVHIPCNPPDSSDHRKYIDEWLSIDSKFAAVIFNSGLHDATYRYNVSDATYESNMRGVAKRIQAHTPNGLFLTSTEALPGTVGWKPGREVELNAIAVPVMSQENMPVFDLYSVSTQIPNLHKNSTDVHYTAAGYEYLATAIVTELQSRGL